VSKDKGQQGQEDFESSDLPMETQVIDFRMSKDQRSKLTPRVKELTKAELFALYKHEETPSSLNLSVKDLSSLVNAFLPEDGTVDSVRAMRIVIKRCCCCCCCSAAATTKSTLPDTFSSVSPIQN